MSFSCVDFTDSVLNALNVTVPEEHWDNPEGQAEIAVAEIKRLQAALGRLAIRAQNGMVEGVYSDDPRLQELRVMVIDYDINDCDEGQLYRIPNKDGSGEGQAAVSFQGVDTTVMDIDAIAAESQRRWEKL